MRGWIYPVMPLAAVGAAVPGCASVSPEAGYRAEVIQEGPRFARVSGLAEVPFGRELRIEEAKVKEAASKFGYADYFLSIVATDGKETYRIELPYIKELGEAVKETGRLAPGHRVMLDDSYRYHRSVEVRKNRIFDEPVYKVVEKDGESVIQIWNPNAIRNAEEVDSRDILPGPGW